MAYQFNGSSQYLSTTTTPITDGVGNVTLACWFNSSSSTTDQALIDIDRSDAAGRYILTVNGSMAGKPVMANSGNNSIISYAATTSGYSANTWTHAAGVFTGTSSRTAYINGGSAATNTTVHSFNGSPARLLIGGFFYSSLVLPFAGLMAEVAIWNAALTAEEVASLAAGFTPDQIRPQSLQFYAPLVRNLIDTRGGRTITNNNAATVATHPRVYT